MTRIYRTGHAINETVCDALHKGLEDTNIHATYGILRGAAEWLQAREAEGNPCWLLDKGYFKPGHYEGYYRISPSALTTQARFDPTQCDRTRWRKLALPVHPWKTDGRYILICPPTEHVAKFYGLQYHGEAWARAFIAGNMKILDMHEVIIRTKDCSIPLHEHLKDAQGVITFNSSVGWEALRQGIPVAAWWPYSTLGTWLAYHHCNPLDPTTRDIRLLDREELFAFMANRQFTLDEIANGTARRVMG